MKFLNEISFFNTYFMFKSSKYFTIDTSSFNPFLLLVFIINYLPSLSLYITYSGLNAMFLSSGSPGNTCQWSKAERQNAWPTV